jgi:cystathionine beta-lyase
MRGIKTLPLRMDKQQLNAKKIARCLENRGVKVYYPGLESYPDYELHASQAAGPGAVLAFTTGDVEKSKKIVEGVVLFTISVSFGCVNSLISMPGKRQR